MSNEKRSVWTIKINKQKIGLTIAIGIGLITLLNVVVDNPYTHKLIKQEIERKIPENLPVDLRYQAMSVSLFPISVDLFGIKIAEKRLPDEIPIIQADQLSLSIDVLNTLLGEPRISEVKIRSPKISLTPKTLSRYQKIFETSTKKGPKKTVDPSQIRATIASYLKRVEVSGLNFSWNATTLKPSGDESFLEGFFINLSNVNFSVELHKKNIVLELEESIIDLILDEVSLVESTAVKGIIEWTGSKVNLLDGHILGPRMALDVGGNADIGSMDTLVPASLDFTGNANISLLGSFLETADTQGIVEIKKGQIGISILPEPITEGSLDWTVRANYASKYLTLDGFRLSDLKGAMYIDPDGLKLNEIEAFDKKLIGDFSLNFDSNLSFTANAMLDHLEFSTIMDSLDVDFDFFNGKLVGDKLAIRGAMDPFSLAIEAPNLLKELAFNGTLPEAPYPFPDCKIDLALAVTSDRLSLDNSRAYCQDSKSKLGFPSVEQVFTTSTRAKEQSDSEVQKLEKTDLYKTSDLLTRTQLKIDGHVDFNDSSVSIKLDAPTLNAKHVRNITQLNLSGSGPTQVNITSNESGLSIKGQTDLRDFGFNQIALNQGKSQFEYQGEANALYFSLLELSSNESKNNMSAKLEASTISFDPLTFDLNLNLTAIEATLTDPVLKSLGIELPCSADIVSLKAKLAGSFLSIKDIPGYANVHASNVFCYDERIAEKITLTGSVNKKSIMLKKVDLFKGDLHLTGKGVLRLTKPKPSNLIAKQQIDTEGLKETVQARHIPKNFGFTKNDALDFQIASSVRSGPWSPYDYIATNKKNLKDLPFLGEFLTKQEIGGYYLMKGALSGKLGNLKGSLKTMIQNFSILGNELPSVLTQSFFEKGKLSTTMNHSGQSIVGRWDVDLFDQGLPYEWYFKFDQTDIRFLSPNFFSSDPRNFLYFSGNWSMNGKLNDWWKSDGSAQITSIWGNLVRDSSEGTENLPFKSENPSKIQISEGGWNTSGPSLKVTSKYTQVEAKLVNNRLPERLGLKTSGIFDLELLQKYFDQVENATGSVQVNLDAKGPISKPQIIATFKKPGIETEGAGRNIGIGLSTFRPGLKEVDFDAKFADGILYINRFNAKKGEGTVSASGTINILGSTPTNSNLNLTINNASLVYEVPYLKEFDTRLTGNINLSGVSLPYTVSGSINVLRARANHTFDLRNEIVDAIRKSSIQLGSNTDNPFLDFNLRLTADKSIQISNRSVQALTSLELLLQGTEKEPQITGQINVDRGKIVYKSDFIVERGIISFDNPLRIDPNLDVEAYALFPPYKVIINITGKSSKPQVALNVDPPTREDGTPISQVETLILLSRGSLPKQDSTKADLEGTVTTEALNLVVSQFETPLEKFLSLTGQEEVEIYLDTYPSPVDGATQIRVNMPINIYEDFDVILRVASSESSATVQYPIHDSISTSVNYSLTTEEYENSQDETAPVSLDLKFDFAYP